MSILLINSIYCATEGEGVHIGTPRVFVRFQGCNIGCINCDSKDTWSFQNGKDFKLSQVLEKIRLESRLGSIKQVSITGGDPLDTFHQESLLDFITLLKEEGYYINIEVPGVKIVNSIFSLVDFISFDYKTPSSGILPDSALVEQLYREYPGKFQLKSVIENYADFVAVMQVRQQLAPLLGTDLAFPWCLTPAYNSNEEFPMHRFAKIISWNHENGGDFRVIGQQHKWIYGPNENLV